MTPLGMFFVGSIIGLTSYYFSSHSIKLRLRICMLVGGLSALLIGCIAQFILGYREGSISSLLIILLGGVVSIVIYIWYKNK